MNVALYARVSSEDQNVDQQLSRLRNYAHAQGWIVAKAVADTESGRLPLAQRAAFSRLLSERERFDAIVVFNMDRLTRWWPDEAVIEEAFRGGRCRLVSMSEHIDLETATGRAMFRVKMAFACWMPEDMREKQRVGIERAKAEGKYVGGKPGRKRK